MSYLEEDAAARQYIVKWGPVVLDPYFSAVCIGTPQLPPPHQHPLERGWSQHHLDALLDVELGL
jgi:hypothetical protein